MATLKQPDLPKIRRRVRAIRRELAAYRRQVIAARRAAKVVGAAEGQR